MGDIDAIANALVRDHIPLEQGLRHASVDDTGTAEHVRDHIPLEQGLRLSSYRSQTRCYCQRPYSIRTRIKTAGSCVVESNAGASETIFH